MCRKGSRTARHSHGIHERSQTTSCIGLSEVASDHQSADILVGIVDVQLGKRPARLPAVRAKNGWPTRPGSQA